MKHSIKPHSKDLSEVQWALYKSTKDYLIPAWCIEEKWKLTHETLQEFHVNKTKTETYRYLLKKDGMPYGASQSLDAWVSLNIYLGCLGHPQAWSLASPPSPHIETSTIFERFIHTKLNKTLVRSIGIIKKITTLSTTANPFIFYFCIIAIVL